MRFFTSDTHFGHKKAPAWRGFDTVPGMDAALILYWNKRVGVDDEVFHLGDFAFAGRTRVEELLGQLNGRKYLIVGNHDPSSTRNAAGWTAVYAMETVWLGSRRAEMIHNPAEASGSWSIVLHGHLHGMTDLHPFERRPGTKYLDVGVDAGWRCRPASEEEIITKLKEIA